MINLKNEACSGSDADVLVKNDEESIQTIKLTDKEKQLALRLADFFISKKLTQKQLAEKAENHLIIASKIKKQFKSKTTHH